MFTFSTIVRKDVRLLPRKNVPFAMQALDVVPLS